MWIDYPQLIHGYPPSFACLGGLWILSITKDKLALEAGQDLEMQGLKK